MAQKKDPCVELSKEYKLLLLCARTRMTEDIGEEIKLLIQQDIDWDCLLQISVKHRLTSLLYLQLNSVCSDLVPPGIMERLKTHFNDNARINLLFMGELQRVLDIFESQGIKTIPYKGPVLAVQAYGNLALREFGDLDIFIQKQDFLKVKELLLANGYQAQLQLDDSQERKYLQSQREYKFINPVTNINFELHWNFTGLSFSGNWSHFQNPLNYQQTETGILSLKPEDMIIVLCIHASGHLWEYLSWICDMNEFIESNKNMDWQYLMETANKLGITRILNVNLLLVSNLLGLDLPHEILRYIKKDKTIMDIVLKIKGNLLNGNDESLSVYDKAVLRLKLREKGFNKFKDFLVLLFMPTTNEWKFYPLPSYLYILYFFLRPINIWKGEY